MTIVGFSTNLNLVLQIEWLGPILFTYSRIRWKPTPPCKLWKLQSEPHDVDPKEGS
jgi:hypothetical protein